MGMFDYIKVEQVLPGQSEVTNINYQTKSFECLMDNYVITAKGELYREKWDFEWIEDDRYVFFKGYLNKIPETYRREYLRDFHGDVIFYGDTSRADGKFRDYYARFTEGLLTRMWYVDTNY
jgi:hypothetical protein